MLVDSHCHLDFPDFAAELDAIVARAKAAGVARLVTISTRVKKHAQLIAIAEKFPEVFCSVGTHPHHADEEMDIDAGALIAIAQHPKVVAIGEAGLDYHYDTGPRENQAKSFRQHIEAARKTGLPLVIHARDADADMAQILKEEAARGPFKAVLHCFTAGRELAFTAVELGHYIGFTGILTFKNSENLRQIAKDLPADRLLIETDSPYLAPVPYRGKRCEPAYVAETAKMLASVRGVSPAEIARQTTENFHRLFNKVPQAIEIAA
ncbi:TatD family deoxyribonuclease [Pseudolabrys taiwanensis]|uniref:TatD family deoxyribonuclease n=1 Tax=Pseudolabrys taiwanensis TaxID=331696 RepID=A0A345ZSN8_9HYPH|nr:TatD family hydrolase [Pseudolabrys taiwanensis]AXK79935.1 TatD family deoxyribonuclease [Pseudolabrys taiwanensis]